MKILLCFDDWKEVGKSVYDTEKGMDLSLGPFHHGTTFEAEIQLEKDDEEELKKAMEDGFTPVWATFLPDKET